MTTISTKQLRDNMAEVVTGLQRGESVQLSYRHKIIGVLQPTQASAKALRRGSVRGVQQFLDEAHFASIPQRLKNPSVSFKQEIAELRARDVSPE